MEDALNELDALHRRSSGVQIRAETERDHTAIHAVHDSAFGTPGEANLVAALREQAAPIISLVAEDRGGMIGHIMFSPVALSGHPQLNIAGLAPMAVSPHQQGKGIGRALVRAGLEECKRQGFGVVVVLGHPGYYPRFGFTPAARCGIHCEYEVAEEAFMFRELQPGYLNGAVGRIEYHPAFRKL